MKEFAPDPSVYASIGVMPEELALLRGSCNLKHITRGEYILSVGQRCRHAFFILQGLVRQYSIDSKGKEHILLFAREGHFLANVEAVHLSLPSSYFVQALEDTQILLLNEEDIERLGSISLHFATLRTKLLHEYVQHLQKRIAQLQADSAEERYLTFVRDYPEMMLRVPQIHIASYLGITPESLSRVRKALAHKNHKK